MKLYQCPICKRSLFIKRGKLFWNINDTLSNHIEEEENQIFPESKRLLSTEQQDKIFTRLKQAKSLMTKQPMSKILEVR